MAQDIGHKLSDRLAVGRTSSQDTGVDQRADIIVATASLEVGFNDPTVGAVIQHKAPRDIAQYLQRKGRAGRLRKTRPWTVVVLSDYGRDRIAYQNYHTLFDPLLPPRFLPVRNRNVLRMQAVYAAIDFLRQRVNAPGSVWTALSGPASHDATRTLQRELIPALAGVLRDPAQADALQRHLADALQVDSDELEAVLWGYPRPLMLAALPTALRRLVSDWRGLDGPGTDLAVRDNPLPDFVPGSLFSDLNLPEVVIDAPPQTRKGQPERYGMPMLQAIRQFAPGRVSRRFGIIHRRVRHWLSVPTSGEPSIALDLDSLGTFVPLGHFDLRQDDGSVIAIPVVQPRTFTVVTPPPEISDSSNAQLVWRTQVVPPDEALDLTLARDGGSVGAIAALRVYTHQNLNPVEIRRFATASQARLRFRDGRDFPLAVRFVRNQISTALGFSLLVDGLCFRLQTPDALWSDSAGYDSPKWRALRIQRYRDDVARGVALHDIDNDFLRIRLGEVFLAAACNLAHRNGVPLREAVAAIASDDSLVELNAVLDATLQSAMTDGATHGSRQERLRTEMHATLSMPLVRQELHAVATVLWDPINTSWESWLRRVHRDTMSAAIAQAVMDLCPGVDDSQVLVDTDPGPRVAHPGQVPDDEVWITETTVGGAGIVEQFVARYASDPRRFAALLDRALGTSEWEQIDGQLVRLASALEDGTHAGLTDAVIRFREAPRSDEAALAFAEIRHALAVQGFRLHHSFVSSLANRLLRPGSTSAADAFVSWSLREWTSIEQGLGIELDLATVGSMLAMTGKAEAVLGSLQPDPTADVRTWRTSVVTGLLWPRGSTLRSGDLSNWNPFRVSPVVERWLVTDRLDQTRLRVSLSDPNWKALVLAALGQAGTVTATAPHGRPELASRLCAFLAGQAVESDYLLVFARIRAVRFEDTGVEIDAEVAEATA